VNSTNFVSGILALDGIYTIIIEPSACMCTRVIFHFVCHCITHQSGWLLWISIWNKQNVKSG